MRGVATEGQDREQIVGKIAESKTIKVESEHIARGR